MPSDDKMSVGEVPAKALRGAVTGVVRVVWSFVGRMDRVYATPRRRRGCPFGGA